MFKNLAWLKEVENKLSELNGTKWVHDGKNLFYFERSSKALFPKNAKLLSPFKKIFCRKVFMTAPKDSMIFLRPGKGGVIVVSPSNKQVLKIFLKTQAIKQLDEEIRVLEKVQNTEFARSTNRLIDSGVVKGARWLLVDFVEATKFPNEKELFSNAKKLVMNPMRSFYEVYGYKVIPAREWLVSTHEDIKKHPAYSDLLKIYKQIELELQHGHDLQLVVSTLHADLHKNNLIISNDSAIIIDWEGTCESIVLMDYFDFLRRYLENYQNETKDFWNHILDPQNPMPEKYSSFFKDFKNWYEEGFGIVLPSNSDRLLFLIYALDRTASLVRSRGNNLPKKHGHEMRKLLELHS